MKHNPTVPVDFTEAVKMTKYTGQWDSELAWYSPSDTRRISYDGLRIYGFRPNEPCLIDEAFATWSKFLEPAGYCTVINLAFIFRTTKVFGYIRGFLVQLELIKCTFTNWITLHVDLCGFQIPHEVK